MSRHQLAPASLIITKIGGPRAVSEVTGRSIARVYRWMAPKECGGTGGTIPYQEAKKLLKVAENLGLDLTPADFFHSGEAA